jgi:hypothetical protein
VEPGQQHCDGWLGAVIAVTSADPRLVVVASDESTALAALGEAVAGC